MKKNSFIVVSAFLMIIHGAMTSISAGIGDWKNYTDMRNAVGIASTRNALWIGTSGGLLRLASGDTTFQKFTNSEGLTGNDVSAVGVDMNGSVWVGEVSGAVDVYSPTTNSWKYVRDISLSLSSQKGVNAFVTYGDTMYIATMFGVSVFSVSKFEFGDTYGTLGSFSQPNVKCLVRSQGILYVGTSGGIAISKPGALNLAAPESWTSFIAPSQVNSLAEFQGTVYAGTATGLYMYQNGSWTIADSITQTVTALVAKDSILYIVGLSTVLALSPSGSTALYGGATPSIMTCGCVDSLKKLYVGFQNGGIGFLNPTASQWSQLIANGPGSNFFSSVAIDDNGTVWAASARAYGSGFYSYDGKAWRNYNTVTEPQLKINDFFNVTVGPNNSKWFGSWGNGLTLVNAAGNVVSTFDQNYPGFGGSDQDPNFPVIGKTAIDASGNVWAPNYGSLNGNVVWKFKPDSTWSLVRAATSSSYSFFLGVTIDRNGTKWLSNALPGFVPPSHFLYYNESVSVAGLENDGWGELTLADGLTSQAVTCVVEDKDGSLWVGTDDGVTIIGEPAYPTSRISIVFLGAVRDQFINTIAVDPLNNKWVAMRTGVAVVSPDGTSLLAQYDVANTNGKLVDNDVFSIAFDNKRGIVYFGTDKGLSSLEVPTIGTVEKMSSLEIGPNPFILPDNATVSIKGLADNTTIKILTPAGSLVKEFNAQGGGRAFWDGTDARGNIVGSGVYVVVAYADNGNQVSTAKVAVVRR